MAQDCFLQLLAHPKRYDAARGSARAFLLGITRNLALKRWRTEGRWDSLDEDAESQVSPPDAAQHESAALVGAAVLSLPPLQREALVLFEYEELALEQIAAICGAEVGAVKSRLSRARETLRRLLAPLRNQVQEKRR